LNVLRAQDLDAQDKAKQDGNKLIINYNTLRQFIGWMGVLLPFVIYIGNWAIFTHRVGSCLLPSSKVPYSLSGYYYTHMRSVFVGTFWALGIFLVAYNGYDLRDRVITNLAGLSAIGIATFPTTPPTSFLAAQRGKCGPLVPVTYTSSPHQMLIGYGHQASLFVLISMLLVMALQFRKGDRAPSVKTEEEMKRKRRNNRCYLGSAIGIAIGGVGAIVQNFLTSPVKAQTTWLFWAEMIAILSFGVAWFVKGAALSSLLNFLRARLPSQRKRATGNAEV
jgi:hypothetical protein